MILQIPDTLSIQKGARDRTPLAPRHQLSCKGRCLLFSRRESNRDRIPCFRHRLGRTCSQLGPPPFSPLSSLSKGGGREVNCFRVRRNAAEKNLFFFLMTDEVFSFLLVPEFCPPPATWDSPGPGMAVVINPTLKRGKSHIVQFLGWASKGLVVFFRLCRRLSN